MGHWLERELDALAVKASVAVGDAHTSGFDEGVDYAVAVIRRWQQTETTDPRANHIIDSLVREIERRPVI
jgi:hypothetical protein